LGRHEIPDSGKQRTGRVALPLLTHLQAAVVENEQMEALIVGLETITYLMNRCMIYETLHLDERQQETKAMENLRTAIVALYTAILRFFAAAIKIQNDHSGVRTLRALLNPDKISNLLGECQKWAGDVHVEAELCEQSASHAARGEMRERDEKLKSLLQDMHRILENRVLVLWERSEVEEYVKIVQWISSIPFEDVHNDARAGRTGGTGNWLLEHPQFQEWRNTSDASVLWICGSRKWSPGACFEANTHREISWDGKDKTGLNSR
jgi:hypothetical protein